LDEKVSPTPSGNTADPDDPGRDSDREHLSTSQAAADEAFYIMATQDLISLRESNLATSMDLLKCDLRKPHGRLYYTTYLLKSYYYYYKDGEESAEANGFHKWCLSKLGGDYTSRVTLFTLERKATTFRELIAATHASEQMITYTLKELRRWGLVESKAVVDKPYIVLKGRAPRIFHTIDATLEDIVDAQRRYAVITLGYDPVEKERRRQAEKQEAALKLKEEEQSRWARERQRITQLYEPLIEELVLKQGAALLAGKTVSEILRIYRTVKGDPLEKTDNRQPKNTFDFIRLISEAKRRVELQEGTE